MSTFTQRDFYAAQISFGRQLGSPKAQQQVITCDSSSEALNRGLRSFRTLRRQRLAVKLTVTHVGADGEMSVARFISGAFRRARVPVQF